MPTSPVTSDQLGLGFDLLSDVVLHPTFPQDELERWRRQALSGLQINQQDASYLATTAVTRLVFGDHPYGRPSSGTPESLAGLTPRRPGGLPPGALHPQQTILAVVGRHPAGRRLRPRGARLRRLEEGQPEPASADRRQGAGPHKTRVVVIDKPDAVQTEIRLGQLGIAYRDPDPVHRRGLQLRARRQRQRPPLRGDPPQARPLLRRQQLLLPESQPGFFQVSTFTKTETTVDALGSPSTSSRGMQKKPVPAAELSRAKTYITGAFPLEIETADGIASKVLEAMHFGFGREFLESYSDKVSKVSAADVQSFASQSIHPETMLAVLVGNAAAFTAALKKQFGDVEVIPIAEVDFLRADLRKPKGAERPAKPSH